MTKRKTVTGWVLYREEDGPVTQYDGYISSDLFPSRQAALDNGTMGERDKKWQAGLLKNGYKCSKVRMTVTVLGSR